MLEILLVLVTYFGTVHYHKIDNQKIDRCDRVIEGNEKLIKLLDSRIE